MKCSVCGQGLGATWFSIAGRLVTGTIRVMNIHRECFEQRFTRPVLRKMDTELYLSGWVQEALPLGI